ncbi:MAG: rhombosortase [Kiritimatiellia bacterium]|jgi:rhomboid family GlyGly-CTERM serine protease|nr:rhombosortase [Kiritimatiellia bacterium]
MTKTARFPIDIWCWVAVIVIVNIPLLFGTFATGLLFAPTRVGLGEWWRVPAHPFVHVSWYHLLFDAGAFFMLYTCMKHLSAWRRIASVVACGFGSVVVSLLASPETATHGLCGLSGIGHGLMAIVGLQTMQESDRFVQRAGLVVFLVVVAKTCWEAVTGQVLFASMHFGDIGLPIAVCHAGGVLGGIIAFVLNAVYGKDHESSANGD